MKYRVARHDDLDALVECLGDAGCDDALAGIGQPGRLALEFTRKSGSARAAVRSALTDVKRAIPRARLLEVAPDFVGLTDVAEIAGVSRQNMRKLMLAHPGSFPAPVHEGSASVWHLADLLAWLETECGYELDRRVLETSQAAMEVNVLIETRRLPAEAAQALELLIA